MLKKITFTKILCRYISSDIKDVVVVSAVRTPIANFESYLAPLTATQLGALAIEAAVKQAAIPMEYVDELFMGNVLTAASGQAPARQAALGANLPKSVCCTTVNNGGASGLKAITLAVQSLQLGHTKVAIAGGMESLSNVPYYLPRGVTAYGNISVNDGIISDGLCDAIEMWKKSDKKTNKLCITTVVLDSFVKASYARSSQTWTNGIFDAETVPVRIQQRLKPEVLFAKDEKCNRAELINAIPLGDGAAAVVLATSSVADRFHLKPLARIVAYQDVEVDSKDFPNAAILAVKLLLKKSNIDQDDIDRWEIDELYPIVPVAFMNELYISHLKVNIHGGATSLGYAIAMSGAHLVTHLAHTLQANELGCAVVCNGLSGASAILLENITCTTSTTANLPVLTLYTKDPCPLCDTMIEELETYFSGEFVLKKVHITLKENVNFLRLYRHDIPVLFLNGQFLCMHKLNKQLLRRKLKQLQSM